MKKMIFLLGSMIMIPVIITCIFGFIRDDIRIGRGSGSVQDRHLGKEVLIEINGLYKSMDVEEYVLGILPGTIPAGYNEEVLKAQAILIRTNVLKEMLEKNTEDAADLSYRYLTIEEQKILWGEQNYEKYRKCFERAVADTAGQVIKQEDSLIMALYHEVSIGKTASAKEILGEDISYLQSVESSQDVESKNYMNIVTYTWKEIQELNNKSEENAQSSASKASTESEKEKESGDLQGTKSEGEKETEASQEQTGKTGEETETSSGKEREKGISQGQEAGKQKAQNEEVQAETTGEKIEIKIEENTENGFVKKITVDGKSYTGDEAMEQFGLSSTNFYVEEVEGGARFVCLGKGNCLGVSLYGANCMALAGKKAEEIIKYYYQGVSLVSYN